MLSIKIILPVLPNITKDLYFKGYVRITSNFTYSIFITKYSSNIQTLLKENSENEKNIYGKCSDLQNKMKKCRSKIRNWLLLDFVRTNIQISELIINGSKIYDTQNCVVIIYEHEAILNSEMICDTGEFLDLQNFVRNECKEFPCTVRYEPVFEMPHWLSSSMFIQHILNYINVTKWLFYSIKGDKKMSIRQGNLILAIITDLILGWTAMELITQDKKELSSILMGMLEKLIHFLYILLKWLMGAPAGLKLNNAFNKMLGKYFSYHVQLWWQFLDVSGEKLDTALQIYHYLGYFGFTFQAAVISDMISIATFHSYCIYVYAARLFNLQISGIIALLRFFVGRKYNPLKGSIDSCEYSNQELFVGTVAFTILLLLLPTTTMYYIVFTLFRLLVLIIQYILAELIYTIQTLPLYVVSLWLMHSPKVAGKISLQVMNNGKESSYLIIRLKLFSKSISELITDFRAPFNVPKKFEWTNMLSNVCVGKQIV
ncbi:phosphatidylinositol N-acetylglucosaminyltransferase subunit Q [Achroia grisella]|uniref:phosphatidylinositol N-acetylglucosaminyltransferase subunit Q n=1 Tax=Achroia grisella TaxID=688607 RepID=UPI0027D2ACFB|nr:phosphatidylinositol N-acetylglucosaminyltransferase subunit Q [Achroia grisella]